MSFRRPPKEGSESALSASTVSLKEVLKVGAARGIPRLLPSANVTGPPPESSVTDALKEFEASVEGKTNLRAKQEVTMTEIVARALYEIAEPTNTDTESSSVRKYAIGDCTIVLKRYFNKMSSIVRPLERWYEHLTIGRLDFRSPPSYDTILQDMYTAYEQCRHVSDEYVRNVFDILRKEIELDRQKAVDEYKNGWKVFDTLENPERAPLQCLDYTVCPWRMEFEKERFYTPKELYDYGMHGNGPIIATVLVSPHVQTLYDYLVGALEGDESEIESKCNTAGTACGKMMFCFKLSNIVHLDMHLGNILIAEEPHFRAVVIDFGLSKDKAKWEIDDHDEEEFLAEVKDLISGKSTPENCMLFREYAAIFVSAYHGERRRLGVKGVDGMFQYAIRKDELRDLLCLSSTSRTTMTIQGHDGEMVSYRDMEDGSVFKSISVSITFEGYELPCPQQGEATTFEDVLSSALRVIFRMMTNNVRQDALVSHQIERNSTIDGRQSVIVAEVNVTMETTESAVIVGPVRIYSYQDNADRLGLCYDGKDGLFDRRARSVTMESIMLKTEWLAQLAGLYPAQLVHLVAR